jgi:hypothetical protein
MTVSHDVHAVEFNVSKKDPPSCAHLLQIAIAVQTLKYAPMCCCAWTTRNISITQGLRGVVLGRKPVLPGGGASDDRYR